MKLKLVELNFVWGCSQAIGSIREGWGSVSACAFSRRGLLASSSVWLPSPNGAFPPSEVGGSPLSSVHYVFGCPPHCLLQRWVKLRGEVVLKGLMVLLRQPLTIAFVFTLWGSPMRRMWRVV
jgi:hypothetical protein